MSDGIPGLHPLNADVALSLLGVTIKSRDSHASGENPWTKQKVSSQASGERIQEATTEKTIVSFHRPHKPQVYLDIVR